MLEEACVLVKSLAAMCGCLDQRGGLARRAVCGAGGLEPPEPRAATNERTKNLN